MCLLFLLRPPNHAILCSEGEVGEGGALSVSTCDVPYHGLGGCSVNETFFVHNHVGRKGGAVVVSTGQFASHVEFHNCTMVNNSAGIYIQDDPQGEGGVFSLARGTRLLLSESVFKDNYSGSKVCISHGVYKHGKGAAFAVWCLGFPNFPTFPARFSTLYCICTCFA